MSARARHRFAEHTGELELRVAAPDLASLFAETARALAQVLAEDGLAPATGPQERVELEAADVESLLVAWLDELVYRGEVHKRVYGDIHVERVDERGLVATIRGHEPESPRTAVKAATWHRLRVEVGEGGVEATVVLDV